MLGLSGAPRACSFSSFLLLGSCSLPSGCPSPSPLSQSSQQTLLPSAHSLPGAVPLGSILCLIHRCSHSTGLSLDELILSMAFYLLMIFISAFTLLNSDAYINFLLYFHSLSNYSYQALFSMGVIQNGTKHTPRAQQNHKGQGRRRRQKSKSERGGVRRT